MRGQFPIPRSRRGLLVAGAALVVVLGGAAAGTAIALTSNSASAGDRGLTTTSFPGYQLDFSYPSAWHREGWCWIGTALFPLTLLTTADPPPPCSPNTIFGFGTPLPSPQRLGRDGVTVWWLAANQSALGGLKPNATIDGRPARITVTQESTRRTLKSLVNCTGTGATQRVLTALIDGPTPGAHRIRVGAVICGPDFASGLADVRQMLDSVRFTP